MKINRCAKEKWCKLNISLFRKLFHSAGGALSQCGRSSFTVRVKLSPAGWQHKANFQQHFTANGTIFRKSAPLNGSRQLKYPRSPIMALINQLILMLYSILQVRLFANISHCWFSKPSKSIQSVKLPTRANFENKK